MELEHRKQPLAPLHIYRIRQLKYLMAAGVFVALSLAIGTWWYMELAQLRRVDAFLNASMILGGMGPVDPLPDDSAKLFAAFYALFSGIALLTTVAVILTPTVQRVLHRLHLDEDPRWSLAEVLLQQLVIAVRVFGHNGPIRFIALIIQPLQVDTFVIAPSYAAVDTGANRTKEAIDIEMQPQHRTDAVIRHHS